MKNARTEFVEHIGANQVLCACVQYGSDYWDESTRKTALLPVGYSSSQYEQFLHMLDFDYDNGYGGQELYGTIWYEDGTWSERGEYDGSEWWDYHFCPDIPDELSQPKRMGEPA